MKFSKKIAESLKALLLAFSEVSTDKGVLAYDAEELEVGCMVEAVSEEGEKSKPEDGDYTLEDGTVLKIADGKLAEIVKPEEPEPEPEKEAEAEEEPEEKPEEEPEKETLEEESEEGISEEVKDEEPETIEEEPTKEESTEILDALKAIEEKIAALEERIAKIENTPAAEPIAEEFSKAVKSANTKDAHLEFLKKMASGK